MRLFIRHGLILFGVIPLLAAYLMWSSYADQVAEIAALEASGVVAEAVLHGKLTHLAGGRQRDPDKTHILIYRYSTAGGDYEFEQSVSASVFAAAELGERRPLVTLPDDPSVRRIGEPGDLAGPDNILLYFAIALLAYVVWHVVRTLVWLPGAIRATTDGTLRRAIVTSGMIRDGEAPRHNIFDMGRAKGFPILLERLAWRYTDPDGVERRGRSAPGGSFASRKYHYGDPIDIYEHPTDPARSYWSYDLFAEPPPH
ncbi:MAG: hypothetical protein AAGE18_19450 [Pseudomonadota bacterium]